MSLKIGFIGAGGIAGAHVAGLRKMADVQLVAFSDVQEERAARLAADTGAKVFTDWLKMLDTEQMDAVYICVPPHVHGAPELACVERKLCLGPALHLSPAASGNRRRASATAM